MPEHDDYLRPPEARERFAAVPQAEVIGVDGAKHLWVGDAEKVLDLVVARVAPSVDVPLPTEWDGPMETADTSAYADRTTAAFKDVPALMPVSSATALHGTPPGAGPTSRTSRGSRPPSGSPAAPR